MASFVIRKLDYRKKTIALLSISLPTTLWRIHTLRTPNCRELVDILKTSMVCKQNQERSSTLSILETWVLNLEEQSLHD